MVVYEVTADVAPATIPAYEAYMRDTHIPEVLSTGCFVSATIARSMPGRYRVRYLAKNLDVLDRYLSSFAPQLRDDFANHLGTSVQVAREVWTELQHWDAAGKSVP